MSYRSLSSHISLSHKVKDLGPLNIRFFATSKPRPLTPSCNTSNWISFYIAFKPIVPIYLEYKF